MNIVQVAHALVDSYVFQKSVVHSDYEALAREIVTVLSACEYAAAERAAQAERARLLDLFSKRMGMSVANLLEHLPELTAPAPAPPE